jgi:tRNA nucleotidyltransferase (CCA-adding enzyme)
MSRSAARLQSKAGWEHFPHDADVGVRGWGATAAQAFEQAAHALTAVVTHAEVEPRVSVEVRCEAPDQELLFVEWLNAIIYEMAVRHMLFGRFARADRERTARRHAVGRAGRCRTPACEPKGATYTALKVATDADGTWSAACIVDV